jgi:hypothetical protein
MAICGCHSVPEKALKARRCQLSVSDGMLDRLVAQIALDGARIDAVIRQFVTAAMAQHMRMNFHIETGCAGSTLLDLIHRHERRRHAGGALEEFAAI